MSHLSQSSCLCYVFSVLLVSPNPSLSLSLALSLSLLGRSCLSVMCLLLFPHQVVCFGLLLTLFPALFWQSLISCAVCSVSLPLSCYAWFVPPVIPAVSTFLITLLCLYCPSLPFSFAGTSVHLISRFAWHSHWIWWTRNCNQHMICY